MNTTPEFSDKQQAARQSVKDEAERAAKLLRASLDTAPLDPSDIPDATKAQVGDPTKEGLDLDALLAAAREQLSLTPAEVPAGKLEAPNAEVVNTLVAKADDLKRTADAATKEREKIKAFLKELVTSAEENPGDVQELTVHGATVFTYKGVVSRVLNQQHIKSMFPDIPENAEFWMDSDSRRAEFK